MQLPGYQEAENEWEETFVDRHNDWVNSIRDELLACGVVESYRSALQSTP
ncbi:hypothetical protein [Nostoc piscinale]|nr:hypothetical protein [Nostoc piscinale]